VNNPPQTTQKDIANMLGYETPQKMYQRIDKEDKINIDLQSQIYQGLCQNEATIESNKNVRILTLVNESGLYDAIFGSQLPEAKQFNNTPNVHNAQSENTAERLADIHKVDESTIRRDGEFAKAVNKIAERYRPTLQKLAKEKQLSGLIQNSTVVQKSDQTEQKFHTRDELAKIAGVSHDTYGKGKKILVICNLHPTNYVITVPFGEKLKIRY